jgi:molybdopterin synthase catalytic subunit
MGQIAVRVRLFASFREACGTSSLTLDIDAGATVGSIVERLRAEYPRFGVTEHAMYALNQEYVPISAEVHDGDEVALIPPVSGGA